ncbi:acyltransferase domain-containing protein [Butyrivibrio sp. WCE2006]|uniref:acyltransferase domain-containing protein n=1 Tax=Butyrivibrio sp. WCE2006 TaxID=1410611 RepID=UPI0005D289A6|nr:acyltransferase domain-containing protein [Butyrivibrio sp. WCE2006]
MILNTFSENNLEKLLYEIHMPDEVTSDILNYAKTGSFSLPGIDELTQHILKSLESRENGEWHNLPEDIFIATMGCFSRFVNEYKVSCNSYGFDRAFWTTRQASAKLFRIGELEYEFAADDAHNIHLHIPSDANLDPKYLNDSVRKMRTFLGKYYPKRKDDPVCVDTWLLSPALKELLPDGSRILSFQAAFDITKYEPEAMDCIEWVFKIPSSGIGNVSISDLPENTTLQRNMKEYLLRGKKVGIAYGILVRDF